MQKLILALCLCLCGCDDRAWNNPYPNQSDDDNIIYSSFSERPKHLDPAQSYTDSEWILIGNIYEPPLEYHYFKRPYTLQPATATQMPEIKYDAATNTSTYIIKIKPGVIYQPHAAFARDSSGEYYYHNLTNKQSAQYSSLQDFEHTGSRELKAADYVYQIKRLADPKINSPVYGYFSKYIKGLSELRQILSGQNIDLLDIEFAGAKVIDDYTYEINLHGKYPQFKYWLAMPFFAPIPWEAIKFYAQPGFAKRNISLDWYPVGTGAYYLAENNPERRMVLSRNPNFHENFYPEFANSKYAGQRLPFVNKIIFSREKESIPYWDKFMQGYYDASAISSENFNSAISGALNNNIVLTQPLIDKGIRLRIADMPTITYWGFNMLDATVGGYSDKARNLRKAIALAFDIEEYIAIFNNGRGLLAGGPIPPEIDGHRQYNALPYSQRLEQAKMLLADAGYANGLRINFDTTSSGDPDEKARLAWIRKQLNKINIDLNIRASDYNRFAAKLRAGNAQMFQLGWHADYPDPENFLFMFYSKNAMVGVGGENSSNYNNQEFDNLFSKFETMPEGPARNQIISQMLDLLDQDTPWIWGYFPQSFALFHAWYSSEKPNSVAQNGLKYVKVDPELRAQKRLLWNKAIVWPFFIILLILLIVLLPAFIGYRQREKQTARRIS